MLRIAIFPLFCIEENPTQPSAGHLYPQTTAAKPAPTAPTAIGAIEKITEKSTRAIIGGT
jgi:hypothetical protein